MDWRTHAHTHTDTHFKNRVLPIYDVRRQHQRAFAKFHFARTKPVLCMSCSAYNTFQLYKGHFFYVFGIHDPYICIVILSKFVTNMYADRACMRIYRNGAAEETTLHMYIPEYVHVFRVHFFFHHSFFIYFTCEFCISQSCARVWHHHGTFMHGPRHLHVLN